MDKKVLDELSTTAKTAFNTTKEFAKNKSAIFSEKVNDKVEDGIETALKYRKYFLAYLDEKKPLEKVTEKVKKEEVLTKTLETVKASTEILRDKLKTSKPSEVEADENNQDDIIIDNRSAFGRAKNENPTVVFYPDGTSKIIG
ncbi:hypothetical protein FC40_GL000403 [Ligilactobacillus hayakitensis DSM 18933 = JCM 14209]|uniref:Uncharacterized protein n=1 Tax=Ligilactobacillus hayakitensis DSM 18933 = JCM 14209 TaxID=1423755 RepID=A0A0R1WMZ2_9LACO|nr:hypothetical protein [Ligilactobacillus hayakitensis]KRM19239.1 hypothetical protein FC40_GL000403 [Ligilactobacillus hayakitensis DSM 18933 = JCM 14209]